jgi:hypothetical protein
LRENDAPALGAEIGVRIDPSAILVFAPENGMATA